MFENQPKIRIKLDSKIINCHDQIKDSLNMLNFTPLFEEFTTGIILAPKNSYMYLFKLLLSVILDLCFITDPINNRIKS